MKSDFSLRVKAESHQCLFGSCFSSADVSYIQSCCRKKKILKFDSCSDRQFELTGEPYFEKTGLSVHITSSDGICLLILHMMARYHIYWDVQKLKAQMGTQMNHFEGRKE